MRGPAAGAFGSGAPMHPNHRILKKSLADRGFDEARHRRGPGHAPEVVENERESSGPSLGSHRFDGAMHSRDPAAIKNMLHSEVTDVVEMLLGASKVVTTQFDRRRVNALRL